MKSDYLRFSTLSILMANPDNDNTPPDQFSITIISSMGLYQGQLAIEKETKYDLLIASGKETILIFGLKKIHIPIFFIFE